MPSETLQHIELKRLSLGWAKANGYPIAAAEVSVPELRVRLDVAAYRPARNTETRLDERTQKPRRVSIPLVGITAAFECKVSRPDYLRDSRSIAETTRRLEILVERRQRYEDTLRIHCPSIRNGDSLFAEYETLDFDAPGYEPYRQVLAEIRILSARLHGKTKFERLAKWRAASLLYVVAEPGMFRDHELPMGWGLLIRNGDALELAQRPVLHVLEESRRLALLHRIAAAGTRAVNAAHGILPEHSASRSNPTRQR